MDKVSCLKRLLANMTGKLVEQIDGDNICDMIMQFGKLYDGKNPEQFVVTLSGTSAADYSIDKTHAEIVEAYNNGKDVICKFGIYVLHPSIIYNDLCYFTCDVMGTRTTCKRIAVSIEPDNSIGVTDITYELTLVE